MLDSIYLNLHQFDSRTLVQQIGIDKVISSDRQHPAAAQVITFWNSIRLGFCDDGFESE